MTLKMPSSVRLGSRPRMETIRSYSSGVMECAATTSGVIWLIVLFVGGERGDERMKDAQTGCGAHQRLRGALRMRHHAHHVALFIEHAGDVAQRAIGIIEVAESDAVFGFQFIQRAIVGDVAPFAVGDGHDQLGSWCDGAGEWRV